MAALHVPFVPFLIVFCNPLVVDYIFLSQFSVRCIAFSVNYLFARVYRNLLFLCGVPYNKLFGSTSSVFSVFDCKILAQSIGYTSILDC